MPERQELKEGTSATVGCFGGFVCVLAFIWSVFLAISSCTLICLQHAKAGSLDLEKEPSTLKMFFPDSLDLPCTQWQWQIKVYEDSLYSKTCSHSGGHWSLLVGGPWIFRMYTDHVSEMNSRVLRMACFPTTKANAERHGTGLGASRVSLLLPCPTQWSIFLWSCKGVLSYRQDKC